VIRFYDYDGNPTTRSHWIALFDDTQARRLGFAVIGEVTISTVWLGLDHSFGHGEEPVLWETLVRKGEDEEEMYRYSSRDEALARHDRLVAEYLLLVEATS